MISLQILGANLSSTGIEDVLFTIPEDIRAQHLYILGRTGTGKSNLLARVALSDIERGDGLLVLDPHGDMVEDIIDHCPEEHLERLIYWDPSDREYPVPMNIFECGPDQDRDSVCSEVIGMFKHMYGDSWGPLLEDLLRSLTLTIIDHQFLDVDVVDEAHRYNATLQHAHDILYDTALRQSYYPFIESETVRLYWTHFYDALGNRQGTHANYPQVKHASSTSNKLRRFLLNPLIFDIVANKGVRSALDFRKIIDDKKVLLVNLSKGKLGEDNSALLGSIVLSRLVVAAFSRADKPRAERQRNTFHVTADEFQTFASDNFSILLSEARKYGVTLTIAHQHRGQLEPEMQSSALNCGSLISFRTIGRDAADVAREFDFTPPVSGYRFESEMRPRFWWERDHQPWWALSVTHWEHLAAHVPELHELVEQRTALLQRRDMLVQLRKAAEDESARRSAQAGGQDRKETKPQMQDAEYKDAAHKLINDILPEIQDLNERLVRLEDRITRTFPLVADKLGIPGDTYERSERLVRIPTRDSYAERERQVANRLTQLMNFCALVRLADGRQFEVSLFPLPDETTARENRLHELRKRTRRDYAIQPRQRPSLQQSTYLGELRRRDAEDYEAEGDERPPEDGAPA